MNDESAVEAQDNGLFRLTGLSAREADVLAGYLAGLRSGYHTVRRTGPGVNADD